MLVPALDPENRASSNEQRGNKTTENPGFEIAKDKIMRHDISKTPLQKKVIRPRCILFIPAAYACHQRSILSFYIGIKEEAKEATSGQKLAHSIDSDRSEGSQTIPSLLTKMTRRYPLWALYFTKAYYPSSSPFGCLYINFFPPGVTVGHVAACHPTGGRRDGPSRGPLSGGVMLAWRHFNCNPGH